ncbi:MAG: TIR domain-containing protein [Planctomycetaceae bacterium]|nr:TIR domain-containing protein [Planctomycetaceae bacterium]
MPDNAAGKVLDSTRLRLEGIGTMADAPRVFLSYSHDSAEHADRVLALADALCDYGIDVILDRFVHPAPAEGWPLWMERNLKAADFVLLVCTETYCRRVRAEETPGQGTGVRWEGRIVYNHLCYGDDPSGIRFIPILLPGAEPTHIPDPVRGHSHYRITAFDLTDPGFVALYHHLTNQPATLKPDLGGVVILPPQPRPRPSPGPLPSSGGPRWNVPSPHTPDVNEVEAASLPTLKKAVDYLFDEGNQILQERRAQRQAEGQEPRSESMTGPVNESSQAGPEGSVIRTKEESLSQRLSRSAWTDHERALTHLLTLLEIHTGNYRSAQKKYAIWGEPLVPPIIEHILEEEANAIAVNYDKLHATLNKIYGKTIVVA